VLENITLELTDWSRIRLFSVGLHKVLRISSGGYKTLRKFAGNFQVE